MDSMQQYAENQRNAYEKLVTGKPAAQAAVGPDYADLEKEARHHADICLNPISMRDTRLAIFEQMARCLSEAGMVFLEFFFYPGASRERIPDRHAAWSENRLARTTNSGCDVWITPDQLGDVYADLRRFFEDLRFQEVDLVDDPHNDRAGKIYAFQRNHLLVSGVRKRTLAPVYYGTDVPSIKRHYAD